jgi:hypothetical protein
MQNAECKMRLHSAFCILHFKWLQRGIVQAALDRHPRVAAFWDDPAAHLGATIARLTQEA